MKIADGFILKSVENNGEVKHVVLTVGKATEKLNGIINLNKTGAYIFQGVSDGKTVDEICNGLVKDFNGEAETVKKDVDVFIKQLKNIGAIDD